jgi:hypothetical protein
MVLSRKLLEWIRKMTPRAPSFRRERIIMRLTAGIVGMIPTWAVMQAMSLLSGLKRSRCALKKLRALQQISMGLLTMRLWRCPYSKRRYGSPVWFWPNHRQRQLQEDMVSMTGAFR